MSGCRESKRPAALPGQRGYRIARATLPGVTNDIFTAGRAFLDREGRLIERRLAAVLFDGAGPSGVVDAVRAYWPRRSGTGRTRRTRPTG